MNENPELGCCVFNPVLVFVPNAETDCVAFEPKVNDMDEFPESLEAAMGVSFVFVVGLVVLNVNEGVFVVEFVSDVTTEPNVNPLVVVFAILDEEVVLAGAEEDVRVPNTAVGTEEEVDGTVKLKLLLGFTTLLDTGFDAVVFGVGTVTFVPKVKALDVAADIAVFEETGVVFVGKVNAVPTEENWDELS